MFIGLAAGHRVAGVGWPPLPAGVPVRLSVSEETAFHPQKQGVFGFSPMCIVDARATPPGARLHPPAIDADAR